MIYADIEEKVSKVQGYMDSLAQRHFMFNLGKMSKVGAEIGSFKGLSAFIVGNGMKASGGKYYCIDTFKAENPELKEEDTFFAFSKAVEGLQDIIVPVMCLSFEQKALMEVPNNLDFIYIDGAHDADSVHNDILNYYDKVKKNGLLLFHDATWETVKDGIQRGQKDTGMKFLFQEDDFAVFTK